MLERKQATVSGEKCNISLEEEVLGTLSVCAKCYYSQKELIAALLLTLQRFFSFRVRGRVFQSIRVAKGIRAGHCHANPSRVGESDTGPPIGSNHEKGAFVELGLA